MYNLKNWPDSVYQREIEPLKEVAAKADVLLLQMKKQGPRPAGYTVKNLGGIHGGLWQINLKVNRNQYRLLYAPYGYSIVLFHFHKKTSPQEQKRGYAKALSRKKEVDAMPRQGEGNEIRTIH